MSEQDQPKQDAERRAQALAEMGLDDPNDENWERETPYDYMPYLVSHPKGSAKEIEAALRLRGLRLRKDLNQSLNQNPDAWKALNRPAPLHSASLTLAEMLRDIPQMTAINFTSSVKATFTCRRTLWRSIHTQRYASCNSYTRMQASAYPRG